MLGVLVTCVLIAAICGCGSAKGPALAKVRGLVTLDGLPLTKGSVEFTPDSSQGTRGRMAIGAIQPDGTFDLTTFKSGDGAIVGCHTVAIVCNDYRPTDPRNADSFQTVVPLIPARYTDGKTSGLGVEVKQGVRNEFAFELKR